MRVLSCVPRCSVGRPCSALRSQAAIQAYPHAGVKTHRLRVALLRGRGLSLNALSPKQNGAASKEETLAVAVDEGVAPKNRIDAETSATSKMAGLETALETALFSSRYLVMLAVIGTISTSAIMFVKGITTVIAEFDALRAGESNEVGLLAIASLDDFLTGCAALVFGLGLYELFISKLEVAYEQSAEMGSFTLDKIPNWLRVESLSDLKHSLGAVIILVMVVNIFELSKEIRATDTESLVFLSIATLLSSLAIYTIGSGGRHHSSNHSAGHSTSSAKVGSVKATDKDNHH